MKTYHQKKRKLRYLSVLILVVSVAGCERGLEAQPSVSDGANMITVDSYMERMVELGFSGGVLIARDGEVIHSKGYGFADRDGQISFAPTTIFPVGSLTKQFTGAAIVKLASGGLLSFDDTLPDYFESVPADKRAITLHQLLTHSSGLVDAIGFDFAPIEKQDFIAQALQSELETAPGSTYSYSNVGYSLLAAIVEDVSGMSYNEYVTAKLFVPSGMQDTGYHILAAEPSRLAHGYRDEQDWGTMADKAWADDGPYWHLRGNGGIHSTLTDMYRWHVALLGEEVLSDEAKRDYFAPHVQEGDGAQSYYGYGWVTQDSDYGRLIWHDGGNPYFSSDMRRYVDEDVVIIVTSNTGDHKAMAVMRDLAKIVFGDPVGLPPLSIPEMEPDVWQESVVGSRGMELLRVFASSPEDVERFVDVHVAEALIEKVGEDRLKVILLAEQERLGEVMIGKIEVLDENRHRVTVKSHIAQEWFALTVIAAEEPPHLITGFLMDEATEPSRSAGENRGDSVVEVNPDELVERLVAAIGSGDEDVYREFIGADLDPQFRDDIPMETHLAAFGNMHADLGGSPEVLDVDMPSPWEIDARVRGADGIFRLSVGLSAKRKIEGVQLERE